MTSKNILLSVIFSGAFFTASAMGMERYNVSKEGDKITASSFCGDDKYFSQTVVSKDLENGKFTCTACSSFRVYDDLRYCGFAQDIDCDVSVDDKEVIKLKKKIEEFEKAEREKEEKEKTEKKLDFGSEKK